MPYTMMKNALLIFMLALGWSLTGVPCSYGQQPFQNPYQEGSEVTRFDFRHDQRVHRPRYKRIRYFYRVNTKGYLYGNRCLMEYTRSKGYEYVVMPPWQPQSGTKFTRFMHNAGVGLVISLKNGPFWKLQLKRQVKRCRRLSGDFAG